METHFTQVPNQIFDVYLSQLTLAELKVLLLVIRQTRGWVYGKSKKRKVRDRITHSQFIHKTGICRKVLSHAIQSLVEDRLLLVTGYDGQILDTPEKRKGRQYLLYELTIPTHVHEKRMNCAIDNLRPVHQMPYNKRKYSKENEIEIKQVGNILKELYGELFQ
jgi:phage replication O-like protein O